MYVCVLGIPKGKFLCERCLPALLKTKLLFFLILISRHQSEQNAESLSNFSCIPSADLDNLKLKPQFTLLITLLSRYCCMAVKFGVILTRLPHGLEMEIFQ
jgi:hypothetical protein